MRIGVDFDNTILCFDPIFHRAALEQKLIPPEIPAVKEHIRDYLRKIDREDDWTRLQGAVYGDRIREAVPFPGVKDFFAACEKNHIFVAIVSHKTQKPFLGPAYDLHEAARQWLKSQKFYDETGLKPENVYFELTKEKKIQRVLDLKATHFIDDLPEFLADPSFKGDVVKMLFDPAAAHQDEKTFPRFENWKDIRTWLMPNSK